RFRVHQDRLPADLDRFCGFKDDSAKVANGIDEAQAQGLLSRPYSAIGDGLYVANLGVASIGHRLHKLVIHIVDEPLQILSCSRGKLARRVPRILEDSYLENFGFQLGPTHQIAVVHPFGDHPDRAHDTTAIGIDLVSCRGHIVGAACPHGLDRGNDIFVLFVANSLDLAVNLLGSGYSAAGRVYMHDDGLNRVIISKLPQLLDHFAGIKNDAFEINDPNLLAERIKSGPPAADMQSNVNQCEYRQHKEEERSSADQHPQPNTRARGRFTHKL